MAIRNIPNYQKIIIASALILSLFAFWSFAIKESSEVFGGTFSPQMNPPAQGGYQISGCDSSSAWVIDTNTGDVYLIYSNGKWKEVGSIFDEQKKIKK